MVMQWSFSLMTKKQRVLLLLIDTPESIHPDKEAQPFDHESSQFTKNILTEGKRLNWKKRLLNLINMTIYYAISL